MLQVFLFGAGASRDAGLPDAFQLTDVLVNEIGALGSAYAEPLTFVLDHLRDTFGETSVGR
jgi:hypothetical protein